jgi:hypothetical protein
MKTINKEVYQLRKKDFKPVFGLINYIKRCEEEIKEFPVYCNNEEYKAECWGRSSILGLYNLTITGIAGIAIAYGKSLLEVLLSK